MNKQSLRAITTKVVMALLLLSVMLSLTGCVTGTIYGRKLQEASGVDLSQGSLNMKRIMEDLVTDNLSDIDTLGYHYGREDAASFEDFKAQWAIYKEEYGLPVEGQMDEAYQFANDFVFVFLMKMENGGKLYLQGLFNNALQMTGLMIYETEEAFNAKLPMPETIVEMDITLGEGTNYPLAGKVTMPKEALEGGSFKAAVLVPGDGANTMDMKAGSTRLYRDLAWKLAEEGIVTIRYDKRLYTYSVEATMQDAPLSVFTVNWEYTEDANLAFQYLADMDYVDESQIYYVGHSVGATVGSRAEKENPYGSYAGFVLINSSPRALSDVIYDQYINYGLIDRADDEIYYLVSKLQTEKKFIEDGSVLKVSGEELTADFPLGRSAAFWQDYLSFDYVSTYQELKKPMLILQGGNDYQITEEVDFAAWKNVLSDASYASFASYEGLNHLMVTSKGAFAGHYKEYDIPGVADETFMKDVVSFILTGKAGH